MDDTFYSAFLEGDSKVLGVTLKPFSLWHQFLLEAINSPLVSGTEPDPNDILLAVEVFKTSFPDEPDFRVTPRRLLRSFRINRNKKKLEQLTEVVGNYIKSNSSLPSFQKSMQDQMGGGLTSPPVMQTVVSLIKFGWSEEAAWNMSIGRSRWYEAAMMERDSSSIKFIYQGDIDAFKEFNERSNDEVYQQAVKDLGQEQADIWWKRNQEIKSWD